MRSVSTKASFDPLTDFSIVGSDTARTFDVRTSNVTALRCASNTSATYETLRDEARRQQRGSSDVAHALAITKLYNLTGGRGTVDPRRLTVLD